ncbi:unnamed protein product [Mesocestoides corti]|uniref:IRS-type PTB domain-containing protein n=3 Tax=Mesocestoides corti TaxID=53468 RepID=A0A158QTD5_MESCO|nr:unnamed protein product [Mesocestoides corti]
MEQFCLVYGKTEAVVYIAVSPSACSLSRGVCVCVCALALEWMHVRPQLREYASTVTCRFKAKEFNSGPFPKIKGECLFCLSKLDVLLISQDVSHPDLSIRADGRTSSAVALVPYAPLMGAERLQLSSSLPVEEGRPRPRDFDATPVTNFFPYVRHCASRDDGRLCLDIGRAAPTGECELVLQMVNAREATAAHTRCIALMRQCPTWLKLGRDGPSSRRRTIPNFSKKASGVKLAGPPLPRIPATTTSMGNPTSTEQLPAPNILPMVPEASIPPPLLLPPPLHVPPSCSHSVSYLVGRRSRYYSLSQKSHSFPSHLYTEPIPEVAVDEPLAGDSTEPILPPSIVRTEEEPDTAESPQTPSQYNPDANNQISSTNATGDPTSHYLQLNVENLMGPHIKSITKYAPTEGVAEGDEQLGAGTGVRRDEVLSEETIRHVLAYLSSITRPSKPAGIATTEPEAARSGAPSRQPTVKFSPSPFMIPTDQPRDGFYVEPVVVGIDRLTSKVGSHSFEISRTSSTKKGLSLGGSSGSGIQLRRPKRHFTGCASQGGSTVGVSSGGSAGSGTGLGSSIRNRIYSHRDNDELFADLTYVPGATSRHTTLCQVSKCSTSERSSASFEAGRMSMVIETTSSAAALDHQNRPRTASDTGGKWKTGITPPLRLLPSSSQIAGAVSRPRARSLTHQLATKPLSQPIGVKDLECLTSGELYGGCMELESRSNSTTSTSKGIIRAIEHVLGRPRSIEEGGGLHGVTGGVTASTTSPSHHQPQESEIYAEMDFTALRQPHPPADLPPEVRSTLRGSLLITPSDSLSSNSSSLSYYGGGSRSMAPRAATTTAAAGLSFNDHYSLLFGPAIAAAVDRHNVISSAPRVPFAMKTLTGCDFPSSASAQ